jgi:hypothetical protein
MKYFLFTLFLVSSAEAFTLNNNFGATFKDHKVKIYVEDTTTCQAQFTVYELEEWLKKAVNNFWNKVPTSNLRLIPSGFTRVNASNVNTAILCSPTDFDCINNTASGKELFPKVTDIVVACNEDNANFNGSGEVLAVAVPNNFSGNKITGAVILINMASQFKSLSEADKISVLAHEIGHAIGLGHPKDQPEALMHFKTVNLRRSLGQDDIDGVTYLYPKHVDACGLFSGFGGTIDDGKSPLLTQMFLAFLLSLILGSLSKLLLSSKKTRPAF